jgi:uncharacterized BrkB/YihY/UPF0761 family membrane protein
MVLWVYYSAQIFLFGAEFTWLYAKRFGSMRESSLAKSQDQEGSCETERNTSRKPFLSSKGSLIELLKKLVDDGKRWLDAELALAKSEAGHRLRNYAMGIGVAIAGILVLIPTVVVLGQTSVIALTPNLSSAAGAGLTVGVILLAIVIILALIAKHLLIRKLPRPKLVFRRPKY